MDLSGEYTIPAPRDRVWAALNDPEVLRLCIAGCEELEKTSETEFSARVTMKVGAVKARLKGSVELSDIDPPNSYTISGQGQGGVAGFAKGGAKVELTDAEGGDTLLRYEAKAELGGKLAAVGSRVVQGVAKKTADDFFGKFAEQLSVSPEKSAVPEMSPAPEGVPDASAPAAASSEDQSGDSSMTSRDAIWLAIGAALGSLMTWALTG